VQLEHEIELLINPIEKDHQELMAAIGEMLGAMYTGGEKTPDFNPARERVTMLGQKIFKAEWDRIKDDIEKP
jgi:hypothetical protein